MMEMTQSRMQLNKEVHFLKEAVAMLIDQQGLFDTSLLGLDKEVKSLKKDNTQIKSKCDILSLRVKSNQVTQEPDSGLRSPTPLKKRESLRLEEKDMTPKYDYIANKSTRDRIENLRKDLDGVFRKEDGKTESTPRNNDYITDELRERSDFSQGSKVRGNLEAQQGSPKSPFMYVSTGDISTFSRAVNLVKPSPKRMQGQKFNNDTGDDMGRTSPLSIENGGVSKREAHTPKRMEIMKEKERKSFLRENEDNKEDKVNQSEGKKLLHDKRISLNVGNVDPPSLSHISKTDRSNISTSPTYRGAQIDSSYSFDSRNEPIFAGESPHQMSRQERSANINFQQKIESIAGGSFSNSPIASPQGQIVTPFGTMDIKTKKEYLKGENMLIGALDTLELSQKGSSHLNLYSDRGNFGNNLDARKYDSPGTPSSNSSYYFPKKVVESMELQESEKKILDKINSIDNSTPRNNAGNSSKGGIKKLKLVRKSTKGKDNSISLHESFSSHIANEN